MDDEGRRIQIGNTLEEEDEEEQENKDRRHTSRRFSFPERPSQRGSR